MNETMMPDDAKIVTTPSKPFRLSGDEWIDIMLTLEQYHGVFYKLWEIGMPIFTDRVETAAIQFDKGGDFVQFLFNPEYWKWCTPYERLFTICHEALHCILNHGVRMKDTVDPKACNIALDIVVNHMLVRNFGFDRLSIRNWDKLCWVDTVFKLPDGRMRTDKGRQIPDDEMFEYYLNLFDRVPVPSLGFAGIKGGQGQDGQGFQTVDDHGFMADNDNSTVIDRLNDGLSQEEKETIKDMIDKHFQADSGQPQKSTQAGTGTGGMWHFANVGKVKVKRKWETVIKKWVRTKLLDSHKDVEQWARLNRRMEMLPRNMFLPSDMETDALENEKGKIKVRFYLDTSGSCWHLKDRFFEAAMSIPRDRFDVELFCFDTQVVPTDIESKKMHGGGGTSFRIIEADVQKSMIDEKAKGGKGKYPDAVFVMTDGYGDKVTPTMPERWHWFIDGATEYSLKSFVGSYIPKESIVHNLADYQ